VGKTLTHPEYYYTMQDEIIALMDDQAGKPFDVTSFKRHFRRVATRHGISGDTYQAHYRIIMGMVASKLPKMKPRQATLT